MVFSSPLILPIFASGFKFQIIKTSFILELATDTPGLTQFK